MTAFAGGWICPECWTPNRSRDNWCVGCGEHGQDSMGETPEVFVVPDDVSDNRSALPYPLGAFVAAVGALWMASAVVGLLVYMIQVGFIAVEVSKYGDSRAAMFVVVGGLIVSPISLLIAWLQWKLGSKIIDGARWAWVVGLVLTAPAPIIYGALMYFRPDVVAVMPPWVFVGLIISASEAAILLVALVSDIARVLVRAR